MLFSHHTWVSTLCTGCATVMPLLLLKNTSYSILDDESLIHMCSRTFAIAYKKKAPFCV
jgi:hypothetical protein